MGGNLAFTSGLAFEAEWKRYFECELRQIEKSAVDVRLGTEATPDLIKAEVPDEVIVSVGAEPAWPNLPGSRFAQRGGRRVRGLGR